MRLWKANSALIYKSVRAVGLITLCLKAWRSARVRESDLAITGTTLTTSDNFFRTTISMGFKLKGVNDRREKRKLRVSRRLNEEKTAMNACVLNIAISLSGKLFP